MWRTRETSYILRAGNAKYLWTLMICTLCTEKCKCYTERLLKFGIGICPKWSNREWTALYSHTWLYLSPQVTTCDQIALPPNANIYIGTVFTGTDTMFFFIFFYTKIETHSCITFAEATRRLKFCQVYNVPPNSKTFLIWW